jgi:flagellar biosynthesis chaperone FliJ
MSDKDIIPLFLDLINAFESQQSHLSEILNQLDQTHQQIQQNTSEYNTTIQALLQEIQDLSIRLFNLEHQYDHKYISKEILDKLKDEHHERIRRHHRDLLKELAPNSSPTFSGNVGPVSNVSSVVSSLSPSPSLMPQMESLSLTTQIHPTFDLGPPVIKPSELKLTSPKRVKFDLEPPIIKQPELKLTPFRGIMGLINQLALFAVDNNLHKTSDGSDGTFDLQPYLVQINQMNQIKDMNITDGYLFLNQTNGFDGQIHLIEGNNTHDWNFKVQGGIITKERR